MKRVLRRGEVRRSLTRGRVEGVAAPVNALRRCLQNEGYLVETVLKGRKQPEEQKVDLTDGGSKVQTLRKIREETRYWKSGDSRCLMSLPAPMLECQSAQQHHHAWLRSQEPAPACNFACLDLPGPSYGKGSA